MRVLLDTHAFLWWISDDPRLSALAREVIANPGNAVLVSAVSAWEIAIKSALGRVFHLPRHHRDPFDRLLVAQAQVEGIPIVSGDREVADYPVEVLW